MGSIVILVVGGTGRHLLKEHRNNSAILQQQLSMVTATPTLIPTSTPVPTLPSPKLSQSISTQSDPTVTWETYTSSFGYTIKYPKTMSHSGGNGLPYDFQLTNNDLTMTFIVAGLPPNETANNYSNSFCPPGAGASSRSQVQTINGSVVYRTPQLVYVGNNAYCQEAVTDLSMRNRIVDVQVSFNNPRGNTLFNQILATFMLASH